MNENMIHGIITKGIGGLYAVRLFQSGEYVLCRARGIFRHEGITPLPGDRVFLSRTTDAKSETDYVIDDIEERKNFLIRPALANLTHLFAVIPAAHPEPDLYTADKLISTADNKKIEPVIVITKTDTAPDDAAKIESIYRGSGFSVFKTDIDGSGDAELLDYIKDEAEKDSVTACFAGVSGAGKSTLMKRLFPKLDLKTGDISRKIQRGRHTTRESELFLLPVGNEYCYVADTPGFSMIDFTRFNFVERDELPYTFREFAPLMGNCRYTKCTHTKEEGCAVLEKIALGEIHESRHESYVKMLREIEKNPPWKRARSEDKHSGKPGK